MRCLLGAGGNFTVDTHSSTPRKKMKTMFAYLSHRQQRTYSKRRLVAQYSFVMQVGERLQMTGFPGKNTYDQVRS